MMKEQNKFVAARAMLKKTEEDLGDPISLDRFRNAINVLLAIMSGVSPRIEKDIAKKLVLTYRNKVLSQVKVIVANHDSHEAEYLEHWNKLMGVFVDPSLEIILDSAVPDQTSTELTVGDGWLCYGPLDISRLNAREGKKRDNHVDQQNKVAHLLGILGEHLDSKKATGFEISWAPDSVTVEYQMANGARERKDFTVEKLEQLALYSKFKGRAVATQSAATQGSG